MRPRTFARAIAFQVLYRDDLNPQEVCGALASVPEEDHACREVVDFAGRLAEAHEREDVRFDTDSRLYRQWLASATLIDFTRSLVKCVREHRHELDARIARLAANWSIERMAATDRSLLRLAACEILYTDTPDKVAIDEALDLAKRFGTAQSAQFVNGILDRLMHEKNDEGNPKSETSTNP